MVKKQIQYDQILISNIEMEQPSGLHSSQFEKPYISNGVQSQNIQIPQSQAKLPSSSKDLSQFHGAGHNAAHQLNQQDKTRKALVKQYKAKKKQLSKRIEEMQKNRKLKQKQTQQQIKEEVKLYQQHWETTQKLKELKSSSIGTSSKQS